MPAGPGPTPIGRPAPRPSPPGWVRRRDPWDRAWLLRQLERIGRSEAVPQVSQLLTDSDALVRESARRALQKMPGCGANAAIVKAIGSADGLCRIALINALGERRGLLQSRNTAPRGGLRRRRRSHGRRHRTGETPQPRGAAGDRVGHGSWNAAGQADRHQLLRRTGRGSGRPGRPRRRPEGLQELAQLAGRGKVRRHRRHRPLGQRSRSADPWPPWPTTT